MCWTRCTATSSGSGCRLRPREVARVYLLILQLLGTKKGLEAIVRFRRLSHPDTLRWRAEIVFGWYSIPLSGFWFRRRWNRA